MVWSSVSFGCYYRESKLRRIGTTIGWELAIVVPGGGQDRGFRATVLGTLGPNSGSTAPP